MSTTPLYAVEPTVWDRAGRLSGILALLAAGEGAPAQGVVASPSLTGRPERPGGR